MPCFFANGGGLVGLGSDSALPSTLTNSEQRQPLGDLPAFAPERRVRRCLLWEMPGAGGRAAGSSVYLKHP